MTSSTRRQLLPRAASDRRTGVMVEGRSVLLPASSLAVRLVRVCDFTGAFIESSLGEEDVLVLVCTMFALYVGDKIKRTGRPCCGANVPTYQALFFAAREISPPVSFRTISHHRPLYTATSIMTLSII